MEDLKALLSNGTFIEQKTVLLSCIKRIDFEHQQVAISCTIPMPRERDNTSEREVLSIEPNGGLFGTVPELLFENKRLIPSIQQLLTSHI